MKKFLTAICSFALVLFMGLAVGCSTTDGARVRYINGSVTEGYSFKTSGTSLTVTADNSDKNDIHEGVSFTLSSDNTYGKEYKVTLSNKAANYTIKVNDVEAAADTKINFDSNGRIKITFSNTTQLSGENVKLCDITIECVTTNEKKIKSFNSTTYSIYLTAATASTQTPAA